MTNPLSHLQRTFMDQLSELLDAEKKEMAFYEKCFPILEVNDLNAIIQKQIIHIQNQDERINDVFKSIPTPAKKLDSESMKDLLADLEKIVLKKDLTGMIKELQFLKHYKISSWGLVISLGIQAGLSEKCGDFYQSIEEEKEIFRELEKLL